MKKLSTTFIAILLCASLIAQLKLPPSGGNQKSVVTQYMGSLASVTVEYNSPDVTAPSGESRKGKIWGELVPYGLSNLNFGLSTADNPSPWRAGANENTVIHFSHDVMIEGEKLAAGEYGFHLIPQEEGPWTAIFSKNTGAWGSYFYVPEEDILRIEVSPQGSEYNEWLTYEFTDRKEASCILTLKWENLSIPLSIELIESKELYVNHLRSQMQNAPGFSWSDRDQAANYCLQNDVNLEEALLWQKATVSASFIGNENFTTLQTLAALYMRLKRTSEAHETLTKAVDHPTANVFTVHQLGRQLIGMGEKDLALVVFQKNLANYGDTWPVHVGLARGYAAVGKYDLALNHAKIALDQAPDQVNRNSLTAAVEKLKKGEDIN